MRIIIVGSGRVGAELAYRMHKAGHDVTVVDQSAASFENLHPDFGGRSVQGDVLTQDVLSRCGIEHADGLAAVTNSDSVNAVAAHVARTVYRVPNVVVRNYATSWLPLHEAFGFQVVSSTTWGAQRIEELLQYPRVRPVYSAGNGEVEVCELIVPAPWGGRFLSELLPKSCTAVALTRAGRAMPPLPETLLEAGDVLLLGVTLDGLESLRASLSVSREA